MEVSNPRRILAVSLDTQSDTLSKLLKDITGATPQPASTSLAGTTHNLTLKTAYYSATVPIWIDLLSSPSEWSESFLSDEAGEVLAVLGGIILIFALPSSSDTQTRDLITHVGEVVNKGLGGWEWDGVRLAIGVGASDAEEWDELCAEAGLEFVQVGGDRKGLNEFGERVKEALEANDWQGEGDDASDFGEFESGQDDDSLDFGYDKADFEGLKRAIWERPEDGDVEDEVEDESVDKMEKMMRKLQAVKEAGEGLPDTQRKRMAKRAVQEVMREL